MKDRYRHKRTSGYRSGLYRMASRLLVAAGFMEPGERKYRIDVVSYKNSFRIAGF